MGIAETFGLAYYKAQEAAGGALPVEGTVLLTVANRDKAELPLVAARIHALGFRILATEGTHRFLDEHGVPSELIKKLHEGRPNIADAIKNGEIDLIINTPAGRESKHDDSYIRMMAIQQKVPYVTTMAGAQASVEGIEAIRTGRVAPRSLQEYHEMARAAPVATSARR